MVGSAGAESWALGSRVHLRRRQRTRLSTRLMRPVLTAAASDAMGKSTFVGPESARRLVEMALDRGTPFFDNNGVLRVRWDAGVTTGFCPDGSRLTGVMLSYSSRGWHGWPTNF